MCSPALEHASWGVFGLTTLGLCLYPQRVQRNFAPVKAVYRVGVVLLWAACATLLVLHALSECPREFLTWGSVLVALVFWLALADWCATSRTPSRRGVVLTVGGRASCVEEMQTRRQFYAPRGLWGELKQGEVVSFRVDWTAYQGIHTVDGVTYRRQHCTPLGGAGALEA